MNLGLAGGVSVVRLARRELLRHPWRTALLATLVALPLAGLTLAVVAIRSTTWTRDDARTALLGRADDVVDLVDDGTGHVAAGTGPLDTRAFRRAVAAAYPAGSRLVVYGVAPDGLEGADGHLHPVEVSGQPLDDPLFDGMLDLVGGRPPRQPGEVAATRPVLASAGAGIGDRLTLVSGDVTVTGVLVDPGEPTRMLVVSATAPAPRPGMSLHALVDAPPGFVAAEPGPLDELGATSAAPVGAAFDHLDGDFAYRLLRTGIVGGVVLAISTIVAAAGFAIGARQQLRTVGLLAASGVPPRARYGVMLLQGLLTGVLGAVCGVGLGVLLAGTQDDLVARLSGRPPHALDVRVIDLLAVGLWGLVVPTLGALLPARFATRVSVLAAIADRRPQGRLPRSIPLAGVLAIGGGLALLSLWARHQQSGWGYGLATGLTVLCGCLALSPWLVELTERLAGRSHGSARFAVRNVARQRLRSGAAVAAIAAPAGLTVVGSTLERTDDVRRAHEAYEEVVAPDEVLLVQLDGQQGPGRSEAQPEQSEQPEWSRGYRQQLTEVLPGAAVVSVETTPARLVVGEDRVVVVIDPAQLDRLGATPTTVDALDEGAVVLFSPVADVDADAARLEDAGARAPTRPNVLIDEVTHLPRTRGIAAIAPVTADRWGLDRRPSALVVRAPDDLTEAQREAVDALVTTRCDVPPGPECDDEDLRATLLGTPTERVWLEIGRDHVEGDRSPAPLGVVGLGVVIVLVTTAATLALTTTTDTPQRALLDVIGAPPPARRRIAAGQALILTLIPAALAVPGGLAVAGAALSMPHATGIGVQPHWPVIAFVVVGLPLGSAATAWAATSLTDRRHPIPDGLPPEAL